MLTTDTAVMLATYSHWADMALFNAMRALPDGAIAQKRQTVFGSMIGTLNHNYQVDLIWRAHLEGKEHGFTSRRDLLLPDFDNLVTEQQKVNQWYIDWAKDQTLDSLGERVAFKFVNGQAGAMTRGAMLLHVVNHKTYHRGWVSEMFFDAGVKPPQTDLSVYLCEA
ncbi:damage-inducible protein DinB [Parapusillimonas sp. SGNA-6]|nr:damage-inducible protein DinB [Parapusillimonas sp. SGNA-6]